MSVMTANSEISDFVTAQTDCRLAAPGILKTSSGPTARTILRVKITASLLAVAVGDASEVSHVRTASDLAAPFRTPLCARSR